jgi:hypothetical protein
MKDLSRFNSSTRDNPKDRVTVYKQQAPSFQCPKGVRHKALKKYRMYQHMTDSLRCYYMHAKFPFYQNACLGQPTDKPLSSTKFLTIFIHNGDLH